MDVDADKANRHNNANNHKDANNYDATNRRNDNNDYRVDDYNVKNHNDNQNSNHNNINNHDDDNHHVDEYRNRRDAKGYAGSGFAGSSVANPKSVYAEDYLEGGLDELSPEEAQVVEQGKRTRRWKGVILDDEEYILRVFYTSFLSQLVVWISGIALLVGVSQLLLPWRFSAVLGMLTASGMLIHWWYTRRFAWAATNQRIISRLGFLNKSGSSVSYTRITDIDVYRPFMSWFFGNGKVLVNTAAGSGDDLTIYGQDDPDSIEALIRQYTDWMQSDADDETKVTNIDVNVAEPDAEHEHDTARESTKKNSKMTGQHPTSHASYASHTSPEDAANWFMEKVWTPNDPEISVQLRRVHYRYLVQDAPVRPDGQPYRNTLRDWCFLQRAAQDARRLGWLGGLLEPDTTARVHPFGRSKPGRLSIWSASNDLDDILLPLCHRHEVTFVSHIAALSWPSLLRFAGKFYDSGTAIIYLSDFDATLEHVPVGYLEKQLAKAGTNVRIAQLALSHDHLKQYQLPPAPSVEVIHASHASQHHVELAALEGMRPGEIARMVERAIEGYYKQLTSSAVK